jgi:hypothetical protein
MSAEFMQEPKYERASNLKHPGTKEPHRGFCIKVAWRAP